jgi:hypothetical protein
VNTAVLSSGLRVFRDTLLVRSTETRYLWHVPRIGDIRVKVEQVNDDYLTRAREESRFNAFLDDSGNNWLLCPGNA